MTEAHEDLVGATVLDADARHQLGRMAAKSVAAHARAIARGPAPEPAAPRRESREAKAKRLIASGAVTVLELEDDRITAVVTSGANRYRVARTPDGWACTCRAPTPSCSHVLAAKTMTTARGGPR